MNATTTSNYIGEAMKATTALAPPSLADNPALLAWNLFVMTAAFCLSPMMVGKQVRRIWAARSVDHPTDPVSLYRFIVLLAGRAVASRGSAQPMVLVVRKSADDRTCRRVQALARPRVRVLRLPVDGATHPGRAHAGVPAAKSASARRHVVAVAAAAQAGIDPDCQPPDGGGCRRPSVMKEGAVSAAPPLTVPVVWSFLGYHFPAGSMIGGCSPASWSASSSPLMRLAPSAGCSMASSLALLFSSPRCGSPSSRSICSRHSALAAWRARSARASSNVAGRVRPMPSTQSYQAGRWCRLK